MPSDVIIRLGSHAEKDYLLKTIPLFAGTVVGANLLESTPGATVSLAWKIKTEQKMFFVDPMTYVFGIDLDYISSDTKDRKTGKITRDLKKSFASMCKQLGEPFSSIILNEKRSLLPTDFGTDGEVKTLCGCVMNYQLSRMETICKADAQLKDVAQEAVPSAVYSPYFYIPAENVTTSTAWEDVCIRAIEQFGAMECDVPRHGVVCVARRLLKDRGRLERLLDRVMDSGCDGCWFWISTLREEDITEVEINNLVVLVKRAQTRGFPLWNMHGGFLSALLSKHGLVGFSHGIGYGESKDVLPVSGGVMPTVAYHFNPLHVRSSILDIERAFSSIGVIDAKSFHEVICDCVMCKGTLKGDLRNFRKFGDLVLKPGNVRQSQTAESAKRCRFHFLLARKKEIDLVNKAALPDLIAYLRTVVDEYRSLGHLIRLRDRAAALDMWTSHL